MSAAVVAHERVVHAFSIDLEDWYHGIELPFDAWAGCGPRIPIGTHRVLDLLDRHRCHATFFTLGWIGERHPELVREIADRGHEIGSHGYSHEKVYHLGPDRFRAEIRTTKRILEDVTGRAVVTHRSPFFTITSATLWALDILGEEGYAIDCSISPVKTWRYGIRTSPDHLYRIASNGLVEFPVSTFEFAGRRLGIGGAYFRIFPYRSTRASLLRSEAQRRPAMFYAHPWEYDPGHPIVRMEWKAWLTHYTRLRSTWGKTDKLLGEFAFDTVSEVVRRHERSGAIPSVPADVLQD